MSSSAKQPNVTGTDMHRFLAALWPICRSITGNGVRQTLQAIREHIPLTIHEVPTGTQVFDWVVPQEWNIRAAYIENEAGERIVDFAVNNLHVVGYSEPVDRWLELDELQKHLYSIEAQPDAIPYVTSYYSKNWGFCLAHQQRQNLQPGRYHAVVDSSLENGSLTYGEWLLKGETEQEIFISTYICHPSMANNELSGPVVATWLAKWLMEEKRKYSYRFIFIPETIGAITYLSRHLPEMKKNIIAGFNLSCVGDERNYSFVESRYGDTYADRLVNAVLGNSGHSFTKYSYLDRGSDERQYGSPGVDLPLVTICRSKFGEYPEYHTSLDDLSLVTPAGLDGSLELMKQIIALAEQNGYYKMTTLCEPQLGKRGLYPNVSTKASIEAIRDQRNFMAYADGRNDLADIMRITKVKAEKVLGYVEVLSDAGLLERLEKEVK